MSNSPFFDNVYLCIGKISFPLTYAQTDLNPLIVFHGSNYG